LEKDRWKVIIAAAGRRIDAEDATSARFPLKNVALVQQRLDELFGREAATALVSSGACGADLVALTVAGARQMRRRMVLPFSRDEFRTSSVTDRPGDWGPVYDRVLAELDKTGDVVTLAGHAAGDAPLRGFVIVIFSGSKYAGAAVEARTTCQSGYSPLPTVPPGRAAKYLPFGLLLIGHQLPVSIRLVIRSRPVWIVSLPSAVWDP
jgi:hypothetical protein